jgi:hypothetical protein
MAHNLFIAYDLNSPGQNYETVRKQIKSLGKWHQFQYSLFYVNTSLTAQEAYAEIIPVMDENDRLAVIDAFDGVVTTWDNPPVERINEIWFAP